MRKIIVLLVLAFSCGATDSRENYTNEAMALLAVISTMGMEQADQECDGISIPGPDGMACIDLSGLPDMTPPM